MPISGNGNDACYLAGAPGTDKILGQVGDDIDLIHYSTVRIADGAPFGLAVPGDFEDIAHLGGSTARMSGNRSQTKPGQRGRGYRARPRRQRLDEARRRTRRPVRQRRQRHDAGARANDEFFGGERSDLLTRGAKADLFHHASLSESTVILRDTITDFVGGEDKIDLRVNGANTTVNGNPSFEFVAFEPAFASVSDLSLEASNGVTSIRADVHGDGVAGIRIGVGVGVGVAPTARNFIS